MSSSAMIRNSTLDRLYLSKGDNGYIYVDCKLPQHQIDGIRFIYRQFIKKNPGVILNDPPGYGKRVQTVLFLNALIRTPLRPILILCHESECQRWFDRFLQWTNLKEPEVIVFQKTNAHALNPFLLRMKVSIMPLTNITVLSTLRGWSVMVVDDETIRKSVLGSKTSSNVNFKILITTLDIKENMESFSSIYNWLYPKGKFDVCKLTENAKCAVSKSVLIDAFLEDIVLRRNDFLTRFIEAEKINKCIELKPVITRKNKDATGTKIKRTKRKLDENHTPAFNNNNTKKNFETINYLKSPIACETYKENEPSDSDMDIETFIRNTKPIGFDTYLDNTSESGVDDTTEAEKNGAKTPIASDTSNSGSVRLFEDSRIENTPKKLTNDFDLLKDIEDNKTESNKNKDAKNVIDCDNSNDLSLIGRINEDKVVDDDLSDEIGEIENELVGAIYNNDILRNINTIAVDCDVSNKETVTIKLVDDSVTGKPKELIHDIDAELTKENGNNESVANKTTDATEIDIEVKGHKTIDDEIFEIEQTALKKFKGSLLDSIF